MISVQRILVRGGAAVLACCLAAFAVLAPAPVRARVAGSKHDFTGTLIPGRSSLAPTGVCSACHIAHGAEPEVLWKRSALTGGTLAEERAYFNQTSNPNYARGYTILCYDCHDNHATSGGVDNNPQDNWFNSARRPQDVAFDNDMKNPLPTNNPRNGLATDNVPGFYENIPSRTAGYPQTVSTYVSGHYVKNSPMGGSILTGDKLPCSDCHDPHNNDNQAFIRANLAGKVMSGKKASNNMSYDYAEVPSGRDDALSREICIACHGTSEQTTYKAVAFSAINPTYGFATIVKPPAGVDDHAVTGTSACTSCHKHNMLSVSCVDCHGTNLTETVPPGMYRNQFWPDGSPAPTQIAYADNETGAHPRHIEAIARELFGETSAQVVTDTVNGSSGGKQIAICAFCHPNPGGSAHDFNDPAVPSGSSRVDVRSGLAGNRFKAFTVGARASGDDTNIVANYSFVTKTCSGMDCHYEYATPLYVSGGWDSADTPGNEPNCRTCHYFRDATSAGGPGATAVWTPLTPQLPNAHQAHVGGIAPVNVAQGRSYPCVYCHTVPVATNTGHTNGDIDLSTAGNPTLFKETPPDGLDERMTPGSLAVKYGVGANTTCENMYCHGADFGAVLGTDLASQGTRVTPIWNDHTTAYCGTCHDVDTRNPASFGQTFSEGKHQTHIYVLAGTAYGPQLYHNDCAGCHGVVNVVPAVPAGNCTAVCHPGGGVDLPGSPTDAGWASFPSRSHVDGSFVVDFEGQNRNFNSLGDYVAAPLSTVAILGTAYNLGTDICNRCHSTATVGTTVGATLAKQNWNTPGYRFPNCLSCHNTTTPAWSTPVKNGAQAPPKDAYFTSRGHGVTGTYPWTPNRAGANLACSSCHSSTSAHINDSLTFTDRLTTPGNALCGGCHGAAGAATRVSTHGNRSTTMGYTKQRAAFELNCVECHDPHGTGPANIFMVNVVNPDGPLVDPTRWYNDAVNTTTFLFRPLPTAAVAFTANTLGSDYAATTANTNKICQTCHTTTVDYQYNTGSNSHATTKCTACHKHDFDDNFDATTSQDGFMPSGCVGCHGNPPNAGCDNTPGTADDAPNVMGNGTSTTGTGVPPKPFDDGTYGFNVNGHGANGSRIPALTPNLDCMICHDIGNPSPNKHNDCSGTENVNQRVNTRFYFGKAADTRNANTSHLVAGYLAGANNPAAKQVGFDNYCYGGSGGASCHAAAGRGDMRHSFIKIAGGGIDPDPSGIMEFNTAWTTTDNPKQNFWAASPGGNAAWTPWTISDLTNVAGVNANPPTVRHHGVCVSCHDPHGTPTLQKGGSQFTNMMVIRNWQDTEMTTYCQVCHRLP